LKETLLPQHLEIRMPLMISDEQLQQVGLTEDDARVELACRFFDANRLTLHQAANWAGLDRLGMEAALVQRGLPIYWYTEEDLQGDLETIKHFGS